MVVMCSAVLLVTVLHSMLPFVHWTPEISMMAAGDENYSPLFVLENGGGEVYNAPIVSAGATTQQLRKWCDGIPDDELVDARKVCMRSIQSFQTCQLLACVTCAEVLCCLQRFAAVIVHVVHGCCVFAGGSVFAC